MYRYLITSKLAATNRRLLSRVYVEKFGTQNRRLTFNGNDGALTQFSAIITNSRRCQSTTPNADVVCAEKPKRKKSKKKFTELLQVTDAATKQTKTSVQKLKANKLSAFISGSSTFGDEAAVKIDADYQKYQLPQSIYADEEAPLIFIGRESTDLHAEETIKRIIESYRTLKELNEPLNVTSSSLLHEEEEDELFIVDEDFGMMNTRSENPVAPVKSKTSGGPRFKSRTQKDPELDKAARQQSLMTILEAYVNVCVANGMLNRAMATLLTYRHRTKRFTLGEGVFNQLLHGYAEKGNQSKVKEIMVLMRTDKIPLTPQTYAAAFECVSRMAIESQEDVDYELLEQLRNEATADNITFNDIMDKSTFRFDQREVVLQSLRHLEPDFQPHYEAPVLDYDNSMLQDLNGPVQTIQQRQPGMFTPAQLREFARDQLKTELSGVVNVDSIEKKLPSTPQIEHCRLKLADLEQSWRRRICAAFSRDLGSLHAHAQSTSAATINLFPYLRALEPTQYADVVMREVRTIAEGSESYSPTVGQLYRGLGKRVLAIYQAEIKKRSGILDKTGQIYSQYLDQLEEGFSVTNPRQKWQKIEHEMRCSGPSVIGADAVSWPNTILIGVGRFLYNIMMRDLKLDVTCLRSTEQKERASNMLPAFYTLFRNQGRCVKEEVKPHPVLVRLYRGASQNQLQFDAQSVPMLCPPQPWYSPESGGYLLAKSELIRLPQQAFAQLARVQAAPPSNMYPSLDALNQLANVAWRINTSVLDVIVEVFNDGGSHKLDVPRPASSAEIDVHVEPAADPVDEEDLQAAPYLNNMAKFQQFRQRLALRRKQAEMYSLWCDTLYRLSLANHYRDKIFWLPHNMDFRGRVYPVPPHLNHLGSDLARSLMVFAEARPLGPNGLNWLKLHCINLTGLKKRDSLDDRLVFADQVMDEILDSADNPLTGRQWWAQSDEPWQTLACCKEIANVLRSGDPENYMSHLPIHQDGSCNGLQHYAALGRDKSGAYSVNLAPSRVPQDVYSAVVALVETTRSKDALNGVRVAQVLEGFVKRKVIKQTVMTTVYGVTRYGARLQIARQLKDIDDFPREWVWPASTYLTSKTFESLREMFTSTKEIQDWFTECARLISGVRNENVEWVTPLGLPIVQPYSRHPEKRVLPKTNKLSEHYAIDSFEKPNIMKQKNAFPPNFIHSLDSSHMMLTSLYCERAGLTFVSVHDCFWTHPCTVTAMNKICREQFVALHSQPILEDLSKFFAAKYSYSKKDLANDGSVTDLSKCKLNRVLCEVPAKGEFDLRQILASIYFFS